MGRWRAEGDAGPLESWAQQRPDLDVSPVAIVGRLGRLQGHLDEQLAGILTGYGVSAASFAVLESLQRLCPCGPVAQRLLADQLGLTRNRERADRRSARA